MSLCICACVTIPHRTWMDTQNYPWNVILNHFSILFNEMCVVGAAGRPAFHPAQLPTWLALDPK